VTDVQRIRDQARIIAATQYLVHRHHFQRHLSEEEGPPFPAITPHQFHMVKTVRDHGSVSLKKLAEALGLKAPSVSLMVDRLVGMGLLTREQNPADRREIIIQVSAETSANIEEIERRVLLSFTELVEKIDPEYARMWCEVCNRIQEVLATEQSQ